MDTNEEMQVEALEFRGEYAVCKVFTQDIDPASVQQIYQMMNSPAFEGAQVRIMPDVHLGKGSVIGFTAPMGKDDKFKIIPNVIGVDIGCFTGDTEVPLLDGKDHPIRDLVGTTFLTYACTPDGRIGIAEATAKKTRSNADLVLLVLDNDKAIRCTPDHEFMMRDGTYRQAKDLKPQDSLMPLYMQRDSDGYILVKQNYSGRWQRAHWMVARHGHLGSIPKFDGQTTVIHHIDFNESNNVSENLKFMGNKDHSAYHRGLVDRNTHWQSPAFEEKRVARLRELASDRNSGYYAKKALVGKSNLKAAEQKNPGVFDANYQMAGKRGASTLRDWNRENNGREMECPDCHKLIRKGGLGNHQKAHRGETNPGIEANRIKTPCQVCGVPIAKSGMSTHVRKHERMSSTYNHKIKSITLLTEKEDVYCLTVPQWGNFALSAGVFVHNCGVEGVRLDGYKGGTISFDKFDRHLRQSVPSGFGSRDKAYKDLGVLFRRHVSDRIPWDLFQGQIEELAERTGENSSSTWRQCGSLGGGNHFIEIGRSEESKEVWLSIHSGSRHLGLAVAGYHQKIAEKNMGPRGGLAWLEGDEAHSYLRDMRLAQQYARLSRMVMLEVLTNFFDLDLRKLEMVTSVHNYIGGDDFIRKGAVSAHENEKVIIPWNMRDGSILGVGQGNADWNFSAPHGAGRRLSRGEAKRVLDLDDFASSMKEAGVWSSCVGKETLDEAPGAYKPAKDVAKRIGPTVQITDWVRPIYNFKAGKERPGSPNHGEACSINPKVARAEKSKERDLERAKARQGRGK